jgi:uncharacterized membrane protein (DUF4010 family)
MNEDSVSAFLAAGPEGLLEPYRLVALLGLSFFLGLAFEEYFGDRRLKAPGGVRTFPLLALLGALLYALAPETAVLFLAGLAVLGAWLAIWYWHRLSIQQAEPRIEHSPGVRLDGGIMALVTNLVAYLLGPVTLTQPLWIPVAISVTAVLFMGARERLHAFAETVGGTELSTLAKFLIIIGIVLPLVPNEPVVSVTSITPYQVWLAVVVVSTLSYLSYLVQRYVAPRHGLLYSAALGGLYSSTAATIVISRRAGTAESNPHLLNAAIVLATSVMFLRILIVVAIFNRPLAFALTPSLVALLAAGLILSAWLYWRGSNRSSANGADVLPPANPLEIQTALIFALLFIGLSVAVGWARPEFGEGSLFALAALAGVTDVDPLVLSVAQSAHGAAELYFDAAAILFAATSNNVLKGIYTLTFAGLARGLVPAGALFLLSGAGIAAILLTLGLV